MPMNMDKDLFLYTIEKLKQEIHPTFVQFVIKEGVLCIGEKPATLNEVMIPFFHNTAFVNMTRIAGFYENNGKVYAKAYGEEMAELKDVLPEDFKKAFNTHLT